AATPRRPQILSGVDKEAGEPSARTGSRLGWNSAAPSGARGTSKASSSSDVPPLWNISLLE
ncbi:MAG: hypothetical protein ABL994_07500, partial [Verrucomicrobiales bacterium]